MAHRLDRYGFPGRVLTFAGHRFIHQRLLPGPIRIKENLYVRHGCHGGCNLCAGLFHFTWNAVCWGVTLRYPLGSLPCVSKVTSIDTSETLTTSYASEICPIRLRGYLTSYGELKDTR